MPFMSECRDIREDLLYRLRWDVLTDLEDITIATGPWHQETFVPFSSHHRVDEPISDPPLSQLQVRIHNCDYKHGMEYYWPKEMKHCRYQPPDALTITNADGKPITMRQFVTEVHSYLTRNRKDILLAIGELYGKPTTAADGTEGRATTFGKPWLPDDIKIFYHGVRVAREEGCVIVSIELFAEGQHFWTPEEFWDLQMNNAQLYAQERQGLPVFANSLCKVIGDGVVLD